LNNKIIKYYKGHLKCQFKVVDSAEIDSDGSYRYQDKISLESRFRFYKYEEIESVEFERALEIQDNSFIIHKQKEKIEFYKEDIGSEHNLDKAFIASSDKIILYLSKKKQDNKIIGKEFTVADYIHEEQNLRSYDSSFYSTYSEDFFGKINGPALIKTEEYIEVPPSTPPVLIKASEPQKVPSITPAIIPEIPDGQRQGCFGNIKPKSRLIMPNGTIAENGCYGGCFGPGGGCFGPGGGCFGPSLGCFGPGGGCFGPSLGCFGPSGGCFSSLGFLPMLLLLAILGSLLWFWDVNYLHKQSQPNPVIIHDTISKIVYKERVDTLKIIKKDTVSYVDSTSKVEFETISLPNVQFYTNSAVLIPSSAKDLEQLAEFLTKNDSLKATIVGHTDSIGNFGKNKTLSQQRAESVKQFLVSLGISSARLAAIGKGSVDPRATNKTVEGRALNRRVEVILSNKEMTKVKRVKLSGSKQGNN